MAASHATSPSLNRWSQLWLLAVIIVVAGAITTAELYWPDIRDRLGLAPVSQQIAKPTPTPAKQVKPATVATPAAEATPATTSKQATTNAFVHVRQGKSSSSAIVLDLSSGVSVTLTEDSDATWQGVSYQGHVGYIYKDYLSY